MSRNANNPLPAPKGPKTPVRYKSGGKVKAPKDSDGFVPGDNDADDKPKRRKAK